MNRRLLILTTAAFGWMAWPDTGPGADPRVAVENGPFRTADGFALPQPNPSFKFPRDHGSHPKFKIEWWYITGHLFSESKRRFGFQATFFRRAAPPHSPTGPKVESTPASALFRRDHIYLAHMALLDVANSRFYHQERLHREGWQAGSATNTLAVYNGDWKLNLVKPDSERMKLLGGIQGNVSFALELDPVKPMVVFGQNGVSRKAADPAAASHYLTFTRLSVKGNLQLEQENMPITGQAWMDHEISSSQLSADQAGWDWACIQLHDGRDIMAYRMRHKDGSTDPFSTLAWVDREGNLTHYDSSQFTWSPQGSWKSRQTDAVYPFPVLLRCDDPESKRPVEFQLVPLALDQELRGDVGGIAYWEGACRVLNAQGKEVGSAFMELTGYAGDLSERFQ